MLASVAASAQSHINIEMLSATYTASPAVKFRVWWSSVPAVAGEIHNAKVWVWIDFLKLNADNTISGNTWTRAEISATPAVSSSPASTATLETSTNKGFWLNGVTGSYSATVTATLDIPANTKFNWCAYVSDCPPNITAANGTYTFKGTPPFILKAANGSTQTVTGNTLPASSLTVAAETLTDKTECPGVFCTYTGADLYIDATHLCQLRTSGAQNWEAWIKDTRDNELYRIVYMPDDKWWLAQNVKLASYGGKVAGSAFSICNKDECGRRYTRTEIIGDWGGTNGQGANIQGICPSGWVLPVSTDWVNFITTIEPTVSFTTFTNPTNTGVTTVNTSVIKKLTRQNAYCYVGEDIYGWATISEEPPIQSSWYPGMIGWWSGITQQYGNDFLLNHLPGSSNSCGYVSISNFTIDWSGPLPARCIRQL